MNDMACTHYTVKMLCDAKDAELRIAMGQHVVIVIDQNGERIEYQKSNLAALRELIRRMEYELKACGLLPQSYGGGSQAPLRVYL